jgi:hypothetical protein
MSVVTMLWPRAPCRTIILALASMILLCVTYGQAKGEAPRPPGSSDGPIWVEAEGEAWLGELETPKEVKERAKMAALSKAVEEAQGIFIGSHTLVSGNRLAEDLTYAAVRGKATTVKVINEGWSASEPRKWTTRISALVEPVFRLDRQGLIIRASLSKDVLREGEETKIVYQAEDDCYVYIFSVADDGSVTLLLPNSFFRDNRLKGKTAYEFPPSGSPLRLEAHAIPVRDATYAEERVKLIATREKEDLIPLGFREGTGQVYDARSTGMISDLVKRLNRLDPADWSETSVSYRIVRGR